MGRLARDGSPFWIASAREDWDVSVVDPWSIAHLGYGVVIGARGARPAVALGTMVAWELLEPAIAPLRERSTRNKVGDVVIGMLGYYLARRIRNGE